MVVDFVGLDKLLTFVLHSKGHFVVWRRYLVFIKIPHAHYMEKFEVFSRQQITK